MLLKLRIYLPVHTSHLLSLCHQTNISLLLFHASYRLNIFSIPLTKNLPTANNTQLICLQFFLFRLVGQYHCSCLTPTGKSQLQSPKNYRSYICYVSIFAIFFSLSLLDWWLYRISFSQLFKLELPANLFSKNLTFILWNNVLSNPSYKSWSAFKINLRFCVLELYTLI